MWLLFFGGTDSLFLRTPEPPNHSNFIPCPQNPNHQGRYPLQTGLHCKRCVSPPHLFLSPTSSKKTLGKDKKSGRKKSVDASRKRRKLEHAEPEKKGRSPSSSPEPVTKKSWASRVLLDDSAASSSSSPDIKNGESLSVLRDMVHGRVEYNANQRL